MTFDEKEAGVIYLLGHLWSAGDGDGLPGGDGVNMQVVGMFSALREVCAEARKIEPRRLTTHWETVLADDLYADHDEVAVWSLAKTMARGARSALIDRRSTCGKSRKREQLAAIRKGGIDAWHAGRRDGIVVAVWGPRHVGPSQHSLRWPSSQNCPGRPTRSWLVPNPRRVVRGASSVSLDPSSRSGAGNGPRPPGGLN